jgi:MoxR-like ATPase
MEEHQVTVEGETRPLPEPFFVIATQNPTHQIGTFPLPESQLDRFLMRIRLGYPPSAQEKVLLAGDDRREMVERQAPVLSPADLMRLQRLVGEVHASEPVVDYCHAILQFTRRCERFLHGLSPRAGVGMLRAAKAWALLAGRTYVLPEDVQAVLGACVPHRLAPGDGGGRLAQDEVSAAILDAVPVT